LAPATLHYHDTAPGYPNKEKLEAEMLALARSPSQAKSQPIRFSFSRILLFGAAALAGVVCGRAMYGILRQGVLGRGDRRMSDGSDIELTIN
jgi:hypothetical protein